MYYSDNENWNRFEELNYRFMKEIQSKFNELLLNQTPQKELVAELQDLLGVSQAAVYRRLQGATSYTIDETIRIAGRYGISLDTLTGGGKDFVTFQRNPFIKTEKDFVAYLRNSLNELKSFTQLENSELFYLAKDIPIYYTFRYPHLGPFKMKVWLNSIYEASQNDQVEAEVDSEMIEISRELCRTYLSIPSTEVWNDTSVVSVFRQLQYYRESGRIEDKEALLILEDAEEMIDWIYRQATVGQRMGESLSNAPLNVPFRMFYNDIMVMDNHIYFRSAAGSRIFLVWAGLNFIKTADPKMIEEMEYFMEVQQTRSALISGSSEIERLRWKRRAMSHLTQLREKIMADFT